MKYRNRTKQHFSLIIHYDEEYNTHTHIHTHTCAKHIDILLLTLFFASISAPASRSNLTESPLPFSAANIRAVLLSWKKYYNWRKYYISIIIKSTICNITIWCTISYYRTEYQIIINQITSNQVISLSDWQWYRVKEKEKEKESRKEKETDWESEINKKRVSDIIKREKQKDIHISEICHI